jgi:hypothetical protein
MPKKTSFICTNCQNQIKGNKDEFRNHVRLCESTTSSTRNMLQGKTPVKMQYIYKLAHTFYYVFISIAQESLSQVDNSMDIDDNDIGLDDGDTWMGDLDEDTRSTTSTTGSIHDEGKYEKHVGKRSSCD